MIDNANAVILGIARNKAMPKSIIDEGYVEEKMSRLEGRWSGLKWLWR
jgi:hypothetical protein